MHHHLRNDRVHDLGVQAEHADELLDVEGVVDGGVGEEVRAERLYLDLLLDHLFDLGAVLRAAQVDMLPQLEVLEHAARDRPVPLLQSAGSADDGLLGVLRRAREDLLLLRLQRPSEHPRDDALVGGHNGLHGHVGDLEEHGTDVVGTLQHLQVDVHVVGQLPLPLGALLLRGLLDALAEHQALREQLPGLVVHAHVHEAIVRILDLAQPERAEAHLGQGAVVEDGGVDIMLCRLLGQVAQVQEVPGFLEVVVERQVESLAEACARLQLGLVQRKRLVLELRPREDVVTELGHEGPRVLGPCPVRALLLGQRVLDGVVDGRIQRVWLVVQVLDEPRGHHTQRPHLLRVLKELEHTLEQDHKLGGIRQNLLVLVPVHVHRELERLVQLLVQLLGGCHKPLLLRLEAPQLLGAVVRLGLVLGAVPLLLVGLDQEGQHDLDLVDRIVPPFELHVVQRSACAVKICGHHLGVDV
mmetsp:Transcript_38284/g.102821  ORF Transcript_38284/g.102821 Transcript_38284/m.102821 type:complete len:470 (+) Transcript_38284:120-1529(+)